MKPEADKKCGGMLGGQEPPNVNGVLGGTGAPPQNSSGTSFLDSNKRPERSVAFLILSMQRFSELSGRSD